MKKFVSAAVITAMIASMGVGAMADVSFGSGASSDVAWPTNFGFGDKLTVISASSDVREYGQGESISLNPGDVIYMPLTHTALVEEEIKTPEAETPETETPEIETPDNNDGENTEGDNSEENGSEDNGSEEGPEEGSEEESTPAVVSLVAPAEAVEATVPYSGKVDKDWKIKFSAREFVENASFYKATANDSNLTNGALYIKVEMDEQLDSVDSETLSYGVYITESGTSNKTGRVTVKAEFANHDGGEVSFDFVNFVSQPSVWEVKEEKSGNAIFDFAGEAFFDVNMYEGEKVLLDLNRDYVRDIALAYEDADLEFYNFRSSHDEFVRRGTLSLYGDKDSYVYEIVDGEIYDVDFKYNKDEKTLEIVTDELGHYIVSDIELDVEAVKPSKPSNNSNNSSSSNSDKNNPDTGAVDFVGSAAALAVTSVAAAGALALKRKK